MGTSFTTVVGAPPVATSLAWKAWYVRLLNYRLAECPVARTNRRYVSQAGSDVADGLTSATAWKTLARVQTYLATSPTDVRISFRRGDIWREWQGVAYTGLTQTTATVTQITLTNPPLSMIYPGKTVSLTGGSTETATVMRFTPATGVVLLASSVGLSHTALDGYAISASSNVTVAKFTFGTIPTLNVLGEVAGLQAGAFVKFPSSDGFQFVGNYNPTTGVILMTGTLANAGQTSLTLWIPVYLTVSSANITLDDYADNTTGHRLSDQKPTFSTFGFIVPAPVAYSWPVYEWSLTTSPTQTSGAVYEHTINYGGQVHGDPAAIRAEGDITTGYRMVANFADCDATPGSFWADLSAKKVYFHAFGNADATSGSSNRYEVAYRIGVTGIIVADVNNVRIRNIRIDGYGAYNPGDQSVAAYAIHSVCSGTNAVLYDQVEAYYAGRHSIGNVQSGAGGIATYYRCKTGWLTGDGGNIVSYSGSGGQEMIAHECEAVAGCLGWGVYSPYGNGSPAGVSSGSFAHTGGGSNKIGLFISYGARNRAGQWQVGNMDGPSGDAPTWTDLINCRSFVVNQEFTAREPTALDASIPTLYAQGGSGNGAGSSYGSLGGLGGSTYTVYVNCRDTNRIMWATASAVLGDMAASQTDQGGLHLNGRYIVDFAGAPANLGPAWRTLFQGSAGVAPYAAFVNTHLHFRVLGGASNNGVYRTAQTAKSSLFGCILSTDNSGTGGGGYGSNTFQVGTGNAASSQFANAYANVSQYTGSAGYSNDTAAVEVGDLPPGHPSSDSPLLSPSLPGAWTTALGYALGFDADGQSRNTTTPAIGPYEPIAGVSGGTKRRLQ